MRRFTTLSSTATPIAGRLAAVALACTLAAACTSSVNRESGKPATNGPDAGPTNPSSAPGTGYRADVPMTSASTTDAATAARNRAQFRTKVLGSADPGQASPAAAAATGQVTSQAPPVLSNLGAVNTSLSSGQSSAPVLIGDDANALAVPATVTRTTPNTNGTIGLTPSSANAAPSGVSTATSSSGLAGSRAAMPVTNPATATLTPAVSSVGIASPATGAKVASVTSAPRTSRTTTRRHTVVSKQGATAAVNHPAAAQIATKKVVRVHIVQSQNGEVIIENEKKP